MSSHRAWLADKHRRLVEIEAEIEVAKREDKPTDSLRAIRMSLVNENFYEWVDRKEREYWRMTGGVQ